MPYHTAGTASDGAVTWRCVRGARTLVYDAADYEGVHPLLAPVVLYPAVQPFIVYSAVLRGVVDTAIQGKLQRDLGAAERARGVHRVDARDGGELLLQGRGDG